jgi:aryl-alcohol dehydrogenase-like predicted oxidoreductase
MLTGTFHAGMQFDENDWRSRAGQMGVLNLFRTLFGPDYFPRNLRTVEELKALAAEYHKTLPQFALRWTTSHTVVSVALVGCRQASEVEENLGALGWAISEADMAAIDAIFVRYNAVTMPPGWLEDD